MMNSENKTMKLPSVQTGCSKKVHKKRSSEYFFHLSVECSLIVKNDCCYSNEIRLRENCEKINTQQEKPVFEKRKNWLLYTREKVNLRKFQVK